MQALLTDHLADVDALCRRCGVVRLDLFGSATREDFDPATSDLDFLVTFSQAAKRRAFDNYFALREGLEALFGRTIDLVTADQLRNPHLIAELAASRQKIYAA